LATLSGSRFRLGHRAAEDSTAVARLRAEGAVILGKTNAPEFLTTWETDNAITGRTNNPWDPARTPGGSSGGEAAAIAALCSPGGMGSDGGGSIRVPAHFCGIAGLKPTPGRISAAGHCPAISHPGGLLGVAGPMARSATDLRLLFSALAGYDPEDPFSAPVPLRPPTLDGVRVGVINQWGGFPVDAAIAAAVERAAAIVESFGIPVEPFAPESPERVTALWWFFFGTLNAPTLHKMTEGRERDVAWTLRQFLDEAALDPAPAASDVLANLAARDRLRAAFLRKMQATPILLPPPCAVTAFPHRSLRYRAGAGESSLIREMAAASFVNLFGLPAVVVPMAHSPAGLPVGVQLVGRPYCEEQLLELAIRLEELRGPYPAPAP
jgi:Asp-tRNA(Asn)/Glu-tRNA(Gln) amidotransferase A subunit family amidase